MRNRVIWPETLKPLDFIYFRPRLYLAFIKYLFWKKITLTYLNLWQCSRYRVYLICYYSPINHPQRPNDNKFSSIAPIGDGQIINFLYIGKTIQKLLHGSVTATIIFDTKIEKIFS